MSLLRKIPQSKKHVSEYKWDYTQFMGRQIKDLNIGIIGYGRLGKMMYKYCRSFGAKVMVYDPYVTNIACNNLENMVSIVAGRSMNPLKNGEITIICYS